MMAKWKEILQQPQYRPVLQSISLHACLLLFFLAVFWTREHYQEEIPIEITEFIRNLGEPSSKKSPVPQKKTDLKPVANLPKSDAGGAVPQSAQSTSKEGGEGVAEDYEVSVMPVLLNEVRVAYPPEARSKNIQGNVVFDLLISSQGAVSDLKVVSSPDPILTFAARNAVTLFKFRPAKMGDKSVAIRIRYTYRFLLQ